MTVERRAPEVAADAGFVTIPPQGSRARRLLEAGRAKLVVPFARNRLCVVARPALALTSVTLLDRLLSPDIRLALDDHRRRHERERLALVRERWIPVTRLQSGCGLIEL